MNELFGKIPPQAIEVEKSVLGAILLEKNAYDRVAEILKPACFYADANQRIFKAMHSLSAKIQPIDLLTVVEELRSKEELEVVGGPYYVSQLSNAVTSSANLESHCRIVLERFLKRELIRHAGEIISKAYDESTDVFDLIDQTDESFSQINENLSFGEMIGIDQVMYETTNQVHEWFESGGQLVTGVPTGYESLDRATRGWQNNNLIYIAARPSVGKTAFSLALIRAAAEYFKPSGKTVAVWSLEMSRVQLGLRMLSAESGTYLSRLQTGKVNEADLNGKIAQASDSLSGLKIKLDDTAGLNIQKLRSKARKLKRKENLGIIFIDYLQLMEGETKGNREQEVAKISRNLKLIAKELEVPIIALSQLSREVEKRAGGVPQLSDLRESGSIEQDADVVLMLYGETEAAIAEDEEKGFIKYVKIAKQRDGLLTTITLHFDRYIQKFTDIKEDPKAIGNWKAIPR